MFDPTIFDNLKVVVEGEIYDLDLGGEISILNREDFIDLATMSRHYSITFQSVTNTTKQYTATIKLEADPVDLYGEILEKNGQHGCKLLLIVQGPINNISSTPAMIKQKLELLWENRPSIHLQLFFDWKNKDAPDYFSKISLHFDRKINEDHLSDFPEIIELLAESMQIVEEINLSRDFQ